MPQLSCPGCHGSLNVESLQNIPAWCSKCGCDLPRDAAAFLDDVPASSPEPAFLESQPPILSFEETFSESQPELLPSVSEADVPADDVALQVQQVLESAGLANTRSPQTASEHAIDQDDRFSKHNLWVGLLLAFWGFGAGMFLEAGGGSGHASVDSTSDFLQMLMVFSGIALFVSGLGIREGEKWGYQLAQVCAVFQILAGLFFIATWQQLRAASVELEESVAVMTFVRVNLDLLIGLVDGAGLTLFLYSLRSNEQALRNERRNRQRLASMFPERA